MNLKFEGKQAGYFIF